MPTMSQVASLAKKKQFLAAADCALEVARSIQSQKEQGRELYQSFGAAAKFFHMGGDVPRALIAFDRCFELFDQVLRKQDSAIFAVQHLRTWPELFSRAAFAALDARRPEQAVRYAELGRARLVGSLFRTAIGSEHDDLASYRRELNKLTLQLASRAFADESASNEERATADELRVRRRRLLESGFAEEHLTLASRWCVPNDVPDRLAHAGRKTAVLYAIALDDSIRLVFIDQHGYRELPLDDSVVVTSALRILSQKTQQASLERPNNLSAQLEASFQSANEVIAPRWQKALHVVLGEGGLDRLLWIPHGPMVQFPLGVLSTREGALGSRVALQIAPSLGIGMDVLTDDEVLVPRVRAIEGPDGEGVTRGGEILAQGLSEVLVTHQRAPDLAALRRVAAGANFVLVSCHGVFNWRRPFETRLRLDADLTLLDIASAQLFDDHTLVLLNSCDAGTVAQSTINEAIGVPPALMAAGAHCVIGASQPVSALAAAVFSHLAIAGLARGVASPEAVQLATSRLRQIRRREVRELLSDLKHPLAERSPKSAGHLAAFDRIVDFGVFQHWGAGWQAAR